MQSRLSDHAGDGAAISVSFNANQKWLARSTVLPNHAADIQLPLQITGMPANLHYIPEGLQLSIRAADGTAWKSNVNPQTQYDIKAGILSAKALVNGSFYQRVSNRPVIIHGVVYLTLSGDAVESKVPFSGQRVGVQDGVCSANKEDLGALDAGAIGGGFRPVDAKPLHTFKYTLFCSSAFRSPAGFVSAFYDKDGRNLYREEISYSPFPAQFGLMPISRYFATTNGTTDLQSAPLVVTRPVAHVVKDFDLRDIRLSDFEQKKGGPEVRP
jgi:hypothetical protein